MITASLVLVVHVEGADETHVQVYELCRQVEVALEVRSIDDVDDHVGLFIGKMTTDVEFFR